MRIVTATGRVEPSPAASVLQALGLRGDVTVFRLNATVGGPIWLEGGAAEYGGTRVHDRGGS